MTKSHPILWFEFEKAEQYRSVFFAFLTMLHMITHGF